MVALFCSPFRSGRVTNDYDEEAADSMAICGVGHSFVLLTLLELLEALGVTDGERVLRKSSANSLGLDPLCSARTSRTGFSRT